MVLETIPGGLVASCHRTSRQWLENNESQPSYTERITYLHSRQLSNQPSFHFLLCDPCLIHPYFKPINYFNWLSPSQWLYFSLKAALIVRLAPKGWQLTGWEICLQIGGKDLVSHRKLPRTKLYKITSYSWSNEGLTGRNGQFFIF